MNIQRKIFYYILLSSSLPKSSFQTYHQLYRNNRFFLLIFYLTITLHNLNWQTQKKRYSTFKASNGQPDSLFSLHMKLCKGVLINSKGSHGGRGGRGLWTKEGKNFSVSLPLQLSLLEYAWAAHSCWFLLLLDLLGRDLLSAFLQGQILSILAMGMFSLRWNVWGVMDTVGSRKGNI